MPARRAAHASTSARPTSRAFQAGYAQGIDGVDLVVFSAPQLSLVEMQQVAELLDGRRATIPLLAVTSPQVKPDADRMGLTARIEAAGGTVLSGMCFYQSYAREMAEANGWKRLATNSAKLTNILGGYGYRPALLSMEACVEAACAAAGSRHEQSIFHAARRHGRDRSRGEALVAKDGFSARYDLDRIKRRVLAARAQARGRELCRPRAGARCGQGRRRDGLDAVRDEGARRDAGGAGAQRGQSDHGAGRGARRLHHDLGLRLDITQAIPNGATVEIDPTASGRSSALFDEPCWYAAWMSACDIRDHVGAA